MDILAKALSAAEKKGEIYPEFVRLLDRRAEVIANSDQRELDDWRGAVGRAIDFMRNKTKGENKCR
jgi:hypothetical protein